MAKIIKLQDRWFCSTETGNARVFSGQELNLRDQLRFVRDDGVHSPL